MKGNFYKCASGTSQPHFLSWMPLDTTKRTFHQPESFGNIILS
nr:carbohydrate-binding family 9-like protein [uncultured Muribaculum sp.]